jgi:hypothetical protein
LGKTSLAFTAASPILFDFDGGAYRSGFRKDSVQIGAWSDVEAMTEADFAPFKTVAVDTVGRALDTLTAHLIAKNPKFKGYGGALTLQGYGALKSSFIGWLKLLHSFGKDVILIAHMDEQRDGDNVIERLDVQGGSKNEIYKSADAMGRLYLVGGKRTLNFSPSDTSFGKNPAQLAPLLVPDFNENPQFFAGIIETIKDRLNTSSAESVAEQARLREMREGFDFYTEAAQFTAMALKQAEKKAPAVEKALLIASAKAKGFKYDTKVKGFIPEPKPEAANA